MGAFFGGIAKAPLAVILMVAEMTGEYALIAPAMLATMVAYLVSGETSIYESQVSTRLDSPAHRDDHALLLLQTLTARDAVDEARDGTATPITASVDTPVAELSGWLRVHHVAIVPVIDAGRLVGQVTARNVARVPTHQYETTVAREIMSRPTARMSSDESLYQAWLRLSRRRLRQLVVVDAEDMTRVVGVLTMSAITSLLRPARSLSLAGSPRRAPDHPELADRVRASRPVDVAANDNAEEAVATLRQQADP
jgi:CIC family chloride channel protein